MIYIEENEMGIISFNKSIINQLISESVKPWIETDKLRLSNEKEIETSDAGIYICLHISLAIGESMSEVINHMIDFLSDSIIESMECSIDDIVIVLDDMFTKNGNSVPRNIQYSYSESKASGAHY